MKIRNIAAAGTASLLFVQLFAAAQENKANNGESAPKVVVSAVKKAAEASPKRYVGSIVSIEHADIMPRVTGNLIRTNFKEGSIVRKGELLYELEDTTYRAAVDALKAQKESLEAALKYAEAEYKRSSTLVESKAVSVSTYDKAVFEINSAKANLKQTAASLLDAENTLSYTKIYAPISGKIGKSTFSDGNLITPNGGKLTDIEMVAPIYVRFSISERILRRDFGGIDGLKSAGSVEIQLADGTRYPEKAPVVLVDNKINASTNTIRLWASFKNADLQLIPGSFVTVLLSKRDGKAYPAVIPSALVADEKGYSVYVVGKDNVVQSRPVQTGGVSDGLQTIVSGLDGSETVVTDGMNKIRPGMTVTPVAE